MSTAVLIALSWAGEPDRTADGEVLYSTSRFGVGVAVDGVDAPGAGLYLSGTSPFSGFRVGTRIEQRTWRHPTPEEEAWYTTQGIQDLPGHWEGAWTFEMSLRDGYGERRFQPGWELGGSVGRRRQGSERIQEAYEELGAALWPLREWRAGPSLRLGIFDRRDKHHLALLGRWWQPFAATLSEEDEDWRYQVGDRVFDPVEIVAPIAFGGISALTHYNLLFLRVEAGWEHWLPSVKSREIGQGSLPARWQVDAAIGLGL